MAYPPTIPPTNRDNNTPQTDNHPQDHNQVAQALLDIVAELGNDPKGNYNDVENRLDRVLVLRTQADGTVALQTIRGPVTIEGVTEVPEPTTDASAATRAYVLANSVRPFGPWTDLTYLAGWVTQPGRQKAQYRTNGDQVQVRFSMTGGTVTDGTVAFKIPGILVNDEINVNITTGNRSGASASDASARIFLARNGPDTDCQLWDIITNQDVSGLFEFSTLA